MTAKEYARISGAINSECDAIRDKIASTKTSEKVAELIGKIDGLALAREIVRGVAFTAE